MLGAERGHRPARRIRRPLRDRETDTGINRLNGTPSLTDGGEVSPPNSPEASPMSRYRIVTDVPRHGSRNRPIEPFWRTLGLDECRTFLHPEICGITPNERIRSAAVAFPDHRVTHRCRVPTVGEPPTVGSAENSAFARKSAPRTHGGEPRELTGRLEATAALIPRMPGRTNEIPRTPPTPAG